MHTFTILTHRDAWWYRASQIAAGVALGLHGPPVIGWLLAHWGLSPW